MAAHSSILAWKIPWTAEPSRLLSMGSSPLTQSTTPQGHVPPAPSPGAEATFQHSCPGLGQGAGLGLAGSAAWEVGGGGGDQTGWEELFCPRGQPGPPGRSPGPTLTSAPAEGQGTFRNCPRTFDSLPCDSGEARNRRFDVQVPNWEARPGSHPPPSLLPLPLPFGKSKTERETATKCFREHQRGAWGLKGCVH